MPRSLVVALVLTSAWELGCTEQLHDARENSGGLGAGRPPKEVQALPGMGGGTGLFPGEPLLLRGFASSWPAARWTFDSLARRLAGEQTTFISFGCGIDDEEDDDESEQEESSDEAEESRIGCQDVQGDAGEFFRQLPGMRVGRGGGGLEDDQHLAGLQVQMLRENPDLLYGKSNLVADLRPHTLLRGGWASDFERRGYSFVATLWAGPSNATTGLHADLDPGGVFLVHLGPGTKRLVALPPSTASALQAAAPSGDGGFYPPRSMNLFSASVTSAFCPARAPGLGEVVFGAGGRLVHTLQLVPPGAVHGRALRVSFARGVAQRHRREEYVLGDVPGARPSSEL